MAADLHLYAVPDTPEMVTLINRWGRIEAVGDFDADILADGVGLATGRYMSWEDHEDLTARLFGWRGDDTVRPNVWIGEVSWLKAALLEDGETWIPGMVAGIAALTEDGPVLTVPLAKKILTLMNLPNTSWYGRGVTFHRHPLPEEPSRWGRTRPRPEGFYRDWAEQTGPYRRVSPRRVWVAPSGAYQICAHRHRGNNTRRVVKRWLMDHIGERIVGVSV